jgi:hypothetical protein
MVSTDHGAAFACLEQSSVRCVLVIFRLSDLDLAFALSMLQSTPWDCLVGGLLLSAVNGEGMSVIVGIVIVALITWVVVTFGIKWFYKFEQ